MSDIDVIDGEAVEIDGGGAALPVVTAPATVSTALVTRDEINVAELVEQSDVVRQAMQLAMRPNVHYGTIPGVDKPTLLKPGAEKLLVLFRLAPEYRSEKIWHEDGHLTVVVNCLLNHIPTGLKIAEGEGMCTTRESRYAWRKGARVCPDCGQPAIIKGKPEYGGGWLCYRAKGGCNSKWSDGTDQAQAFEETTLDRVPNPDLADSYNTVLKMADKRALMAAVLNGTAASDVFTQDMEDSGPDASGHPESVEKVFHPAVDSLPGAITGARAGERILQALTAKVPDVDWAEQIAGFGETYLGRPPKSLKGDDRTRWLCRLSNAVAKLDELSPGEFPPPGNETVEEAFAFAFDGQFPMEVPESHDAVLEESASSPGGSGLLPAPLPGDSTDVASIPFGEGAPGEPDAS